MLPIAKNNEIIAKTIFPDMKAQTDNINIPKAANAQPITFGKAFLLDKILVVSKKPIAVNKITKILVTTI